MSLLQTKEFEHILFGGMYDLANTPTTRKNIDKIVIFQLILNLVLGLIVLSSHVIESGTSKNLFNELNWIWWDFSSPSRHELLHLYSQFEW